MKTLKKRSWLVGAMALGLCPWPALALSPASPTSGDLLAGISNELVLIGALALGFATLLSIFLVLAYVAYSLLDFQTEEEVSEEKEPFWAWFWDKFNAAVPQSQEQDALLDHNYDGIQELDNDLPPWWKAGFYVSILFAGLYIYVYHFGETEAVSVREYQAEVKEAEIAKAAYLARMENMIDETNVTTLANDGDLNVGKGIYMQYCKQCHGGAGEGGVGPNLTDAYWIHGSDIRDVFSTIKYGVLEKGMLSWKEKLTPKEMQQVASFIMKMQGTNPPNGKEPQGELYEADGEGDSASNASTGETMATR